MKQSFRFCQFNSKPDLVFSVFRKMGAARARAGWRGGSSNDSSSGINNGDSSGGSTVATTRNI